MPAVLKDIEQLSATTDSTPAQRADHAFAFAARWLFSAPMTEMLALFGETMPRPGISWDAGDASSTDWLHLNEELPKWLDDVVGPAGELDGSMCPDHVDVLRRALILERRTADHFNFRGGGTGQYRERAQATTASFDDGLRSRIFHYTRQLGLVDAETPQFRRYDMTLVLGGGYKSPQLRARLAADLSSTGVDLGRLYFLGSPRFLIADPPEAPEVAYYADHARDEFDLMAAGAQREFGLAVHEPKFLCGCTAATELCPKWLRSHGDDVADTPAEYTHERIADLTDDEGRTRGWVLSASTHRPPYRPDTTDTFSLWTRVAEPHVGQRALVVTTQVFVPFQTFDGIKRLYLSHGVEVDAVGFGEAWGDRPLTAEYLLQETLSAIRSARRLLIQASEIMRAT